VARGQLAVAILALAGLACRDHAAPPRDAASDGLKTDAANPLTLEIAVTGCDTYDPTGPVCTGKPPLSLSFAPVGSPELTQFLWTFGDGTASTTERAPSHVYTHPADYQVTLVGGAPDLGMVMPPKALQVRIQALAAGFPCDVDDQCDTGLTCVCASGAGCDPAFIRGICSAPCDVAPCAPTAVCAIAPVGPLSSGTASAPLCLSACQIDAHCAPGFVCQSLPEGPSAAPPASWTRGCLPLGVAHDVGASCRDASGTLADRFCTTGACVDLGALGLCAASCDDTHPCPSEALCARLGDGRQLCLRLCDSSRDCPVDPLLACAMTPAVDGPAFDAAVCAPKRCANDAACPSGRCGQSGFCVRAQP
jgi:hypothetical protein